MRLDMKPTLILRSWWGDGGQQRRGGRTAHGRKEESGVVQASERHRICEPREEIFGFGILTGIVGSGHAHHLSKATSLPQPYS